MRPGMDMYHAAKHCECCAPTPDAAPVGRVVTPGCQIGYTAVILAVILAVMAVMAVMMAVMVAVMVAIILAVILAVMMAVILAVILAVMAVMAGCHQLVC